MKDGRLVELAILGLEAERTRIEEELAALRSRGSAAKPARGRPRAAAVAETAPKARKKRKMSAAKKKALSERMKRIWAERRKASK